MGAIVPQSINLAIGVSSAQATITLSAGQNYVLSSTVGCYVATGSNPTAVAAANGNMYVPANWPTVIGPISSNETKLAAIQASAGGNMSITPVV
jgi:hypothetical protein